MTGASIFRVLADAVITAHLIFMLFVVLGAVLASWRPRIVWIHLPAASWGALIEFAGWTCPLTHLENWLRRQAGDAAYRTDFIERYLIPVLYPPALNVEIQWLMGSFVIGVNVALYTTLLWRRAHG